jgi:hypothetical protein
MVSKNESEEEINFGESLISTGSNRTCIDTILCEIGEYSTTGIVL